jgi:hypothetical protein
MNGEGKGLLSVKLKFSQLSAQETARKCALIESEQKPHSSV